MTVPGDLQEHLAQRARMEDPSAHVVTADEAAQWPEGTLDALLRDGQVA